MIRSQTTRIVVVTVLAFAFFAGLWWWRRDSAKEEIRAAIQEAGKKLPLAVSKNSGGVISPTTNVGQSNENQDDDDFGLSIVDARALLGSIQILVVAYQCVEDSRMSSSNVQG